MLQYVWFVLKNTGLIASKDWNQTLSKTFSVLKNPCQEPREINLTASLRSGPEYSFYPHPKVECKKKAVDLPGPGKYYRAEQDEKEKSKASFSMGPSINDLGGCPVELMHCSHCDKKTWETWTPPLDAKGKRPRPKECATKGCVHLGLAKKANLFCEGVHAFVVVVFFLVAWEFCCLFIYMTVNKMAFTRPRAPRAPEGGHMHLPYLTYSSSDQFTL